MTMEQDDHICIVCRSTYRRGRCEGKHGRHLHRGRLCKRSLAVQIVVCLTALEVVEGKARLLRCELVFLRQVLCKCTGVGGSSRSQNSTEPIPS